MFNFFKRDNSPPTERCKLLKEKILDVVEPTFFLGNWGWHKTLWQYIITRNITPCPYVPRKGCRRGCLKRVKMDY